MGGIEIVCGFLILIGLLSRVASIPTFIIMLFAFATTKSTILINDGFWQVMHDSRTDWAMLLGSIILIIKGAGKWSIDNVLIKKYAINKI